MTLVLPASLVACSSGPEGTSPSPSGAAVDRISADDPAATGADGPTFPDEGVDGSKTKKKKGSRSSGDAGFGEKATKLDSEKGNPSDSTRGNKNERTKAAAPDGNRKKGDAGAPRDTTASMPDPSGDPEGEGDVPSYMDLTNARLVQDGGLRIVLDFAHTLPAHMPDNRINMIAGVDLRIGKREVSIYAEGSDNGWRARTNETDASSFPGTLSRSGNTLILDVTGSFLGKAERFTWYGHSSWTRSTLTNTDYAFDQAPDINRAEFPN